MQTISQRMRVGGGALLIALLATSSMAGAADLSSFPARYQAMKEAALLQPMNAGGFPRGQAELASIKLNENPNDDQTKQILFHVFRNRPLQNNFTFWPYSTIQGYMTAKKAFQSQQDKDVFRNYFQAVDFANTPYAGSFAGRMLHEVTKSLVCQEWPNFRDKGGNACAGPNGLAAIAKTNLTALLTQAFGAEEGDRGSYTYDAFVILPLKLLATYTSDPDIKKAATSAFYSRLVDLAVSWNDGLLTSPASREKGFSSYGPAYPDGSYQIAWLLFGAAGQNFVRAEKLDYRYIFDSPLDHRMPETLLALGKQNRQGMSYLSRTAYMHRTFYHSPSYSFASAAISGWKYNRWIDWSQTDAIMHWRMPPSKAASTVASFRVGYENSASGDPLNYPGSEPQRVNAYGQGRNPYGKMFQHEATLMGLMNAPRRDRFDGNSPSGILQIKAQYAMFPNDGSLVGPPKVVNKRWVVANAGDTFFAVYFPKKFRLSDPRYERSPGSPETYTIYRSDKRRNGFIMETAEASKYAKYGKSNAARFKAFMRDIANNAKVDQSRINDTTPSLSYKSIHGYTMRFVHDPNPESGTTEVRFVNGKPVSYADFPVFGAIKPANKKRSFVDVQQRYMPGVRGQPRQYDDLVLTPSSGIGKVIFRAPK
jgi:hypothetical protein